MRNKYFLVLIGLLITIVAHSQTTTSSAPQLMPASPDVAAIAKYGLVPVSKYTGIPQISVPLHTINFEGLEIPLSLSYYAGGIRVNEESGWVGLGWSLNVNAVISREIRGYDDFSIVNGGDGADGYVYSFPYDSLSYEPYKEELGLAFNHGFGLPIDVEPDLFNVSLFGESIKFKMAKKSTNQIVDIIPLNSKTLKGTYDLGSNSFTLIDGNGYIYNFSTSERTTTYRGSGSNEGSACRNLALQTVDNGRTLQKISAWKLTSIQSPRNKSLIFSYTNGFFFSQPDYASSVSIGVLGPWTNNVTTVNKAEDGYSASMAGYEVSYLTNISGNGIDVDFVLDSQREDIVSALSGFGCPPDNVNPGFPLGFIAPNSPAQKLLKINFKNINGDIIKAVDFAYSYFNDNKLTDTFKQSYLRLKLDSVMIGDEVFKFEYIYPNILPRKNTKDVDFWGFYNGKGNTTRIPSYSRVVYDYVNSSDNIIRYVGADRHSDYNFGKMGTLEKLIYPTGGYTLFSFEGNRAMVELPIHFNSLKYNYSYLADLPSVQESEEYINEEYIKPTFESVQIQLDEPFSVEYEVNPTFSDHNLKIKAVLKCDYDCYASINSEVFELINTETDEVYKKYFNYNMIPTVPYSEPPYTKSSYTVETSMENVPPGNYELRLLPSGNGATTAYLEFSYTVDYPDPQFEEFEVGGLRVSSISSFDAQDNPVSKKKYFYTNQQMGAGSSSGKLMDQLVFHSRGGLFDYTPVVYSEKIDIGSGQTLSTSLSAQGAHVGYDFVDEVYSAASENEYLGYVRTKYNNASNIYSTNWVGEGALISNSLAKSGNFYYYLDKAYGNTYVLNVPPKSFNYKNGHPLEEVTFDENGDIVKLVEYDYYELDQASSQILNILYQKYYTPSNHGIIHWDYYTLKGDYFLPKEIREYHYDNTSDSELLKRQKMAYNSKNLLASQKISLSESEQDEQRIEYYYPFDLNETNLIEMNRIGSPLQKRTFRNTSLLTTETTNFSFFNLGTQDEVYEPSSFLIKYGNNPAFTSTEFHDYDAQGNPLELSKEGGTHTSYLWGYGGTLPILQGHNITHLALSTAAGWAVTNMTGKPMDADNLDELLQYVDDMNTGTHKTAWANFLAKLYTHPNISGKAQITAMTYKPGVGMTSQTAPNGTTVYYEYDGFGRLEYVRDNEGNILKRNEYKYGVETNATGN